MRLQEIGGSQLSNTTNVKVALVQKAFGTAELIVGSESMLVNCPILHKWLNTKEEFTIYNALMQECMIIVQPDVCILRMNDMEAEVDKSHFVQAVKSFCGDLLNKDKSYVDIRLPRMGHIHQKESSNSGVDDVLEWGEILDYDY